MPPHWEPPPAFEEYRLIQPLGRGAMGLVYLAHDQVLDRPVAVKFIATSAPDARARQRFLVEARAIARLQHPNVVAIYRVGEVDGHPFLVSELVRGQCLGRVRPPLPWERVLDIGVRLGRGLAAAHRQGVLHRDVKPGNVMLADDGEVKLLDFGVAKLQSGAEEPSLGALSRGPALTGDGAVIGTPLYMAPETLAGQPATARSDVYSLGVLLFELCTGRLPGPDGASEAPEISTVDLRGVAPPPPPPPSLAALPGIPGALVEIIERCLDPEPRRRFASAEEVRDALEALAPERPPAVPAGNPYRGLLPFEAEHRGLFFGRDGDVRAIIDRLRAGPLVLVAGDSGVGKSSLCRAGVLPLVAEGALGAGRPLQLTTLLPGRHPLQALCAALAPALALREASLLRELRDEPEALPRVLHRRYGGASGGLLLFVDQLEELLTIGDAEETRAVALALGRLAGHSPHARVLLCARADFLTRLAALPGLGDELLRALYLLRPLSPEGIREAIAGPARRKGFHFDPESLVDELAAEAARAPGALPLLQFALAALWEARDRAKGRIPAAALQAVGGVSGALALHADGVLSALPPAQRRAARRVLVRLVNLDGTRARRGEAELVGADGQGRAALEALVQGRLLVVRHEGGERLYEVAHEALVRGWGALHGWLEEDREARAAHDRLAAAAAEWARLQEPEEALWSERQLSEARPLDGAALTARERRFLSASRGALLRRRRLRRALLVGPALLLLLGYGVHRLKARHDVDQAVAAHRGRAEEDLRAARADAARAVAARAEALRLFDAPPAGLPPPTDARAPTSAAPPAGSPPGDERKTPIAAPLREQAEARWAQALALDRRAEDGLARAAQALETALLLDPGRGALRDQLGDVTYERLLIAERLRSEAQRRDLARRLVTYDGDGSRRRRLAAPARLRVEAPPGAALTIERYLDDDGRRRLVAASGPSAAGGERLLAPGSYLLTLRVPGSAPALLPLRLERGEERRVALSPPPLAPPGMRYVPPGRFLFGSGDDELLRRTFLTAPPEHAVETGAYFIGATEVTFADWLAYLRALPPAERAARLPRTNGIIGGHLQLTEEGGRFVLQLQPTTRRYSAAEGEPLRYPGRRLRAAQDWRRFPVAGVSFEDAQAYAAWLDRTGRLRGARLCDEREWERAARGADERLYPHGDRLRPDDANFDETYGRDPLGYGLDEVGAHPASASPFGVQDLLGNVWEWVRSVQALDEPVVRGGSFYQDDLTGRSTNRNIGEPTMRSAVVGVRLCTSVPPGR